MRHFVQSMKGFFQNHNDIGGIPLLELHQMDVGGISPNGDLYMKVYSWHNQIVFCCGKKRTLGYYLMTTYHRIVVSKVLWEQRKVLGFKVKVNAR